MGRAEQWGRCIGNSMISGRALPGLLSVSFARPKLVVVLSPPPPQLCVCYLISLHTKILKCTLGIRSATLSSPCAKAGGVCLTLVQILTVALGLCCYLLGGGFAGGIFPKIFPTKQLVQPASHSERLLVEGRREMETELLINSQVEASLLHRM